MRRQVVVYESQWLIDIIHEKVSKANDITRMDKLEHRIINRVGGYLLSPRGSVNHRRHLIRLITQEIATARKLYGIQQVTYFADLGYRDDDEQAVEYEPVDVLANVGPENLEIKETITLLAQNDRRREFVLNAWANGFTDDKEISGILADTFGGKSETHRKFIQRFKTKCGAELTAQAI